MCAFWSHADGQPVRGQRRRQRAAGDEAEVARAGAGDDPRIGARDQLVDHDVGRARRRRAARSQRGAQRFEVDRQADGPVRQRRRNASA